MTRNHEPFRKLLWAIVGLLALAVAFSACSLEDLPDFGLIPDFTAPPGAPAGSTEATRDQPGPVETTQPPETAAPAETTQATTPEEPRSYWVWAYGGLRVRKGPGTEYEMVGSLEDGDVVQPLKWQDGWAYIEAPFTGWCSADYLYELGWYKDVKTPEPGYLEDDSLKGKWLHLTSLEETNGRTTRRAGIYQFSAGGTFVHHAATYCKEADGWVLLEEEKDQPFWVGEYSFDGKTLVLRYMARAETVYGEHTGLPKSRELVEAVYELTLDVTLAQNGQTFATSNSSAIPVFSDFSGDYHTSHNLYKASASDDYQEDARKALDRWFS